MKKKEKMTDPDLAGAINTLIKFYHANNMTAMTVTGNSELVGEFTLTLKIKEDQ